MCAFILFIHTLPYVKKVDNLLYFLRVCPQKIAVEYLSTGARYPKPSKLWKLGAEEFDGFFVELTHVIIRIITIVIIVIAIHRHHHYGEQIIKTLVLELEPLPG